MNTIMKYSRKFRKGSLLAFVLVIGICLALLGFGMLQMGFGSQLNSMIVNSGISARTAADAGLTMALYKLNQKLNVWPRNFSVLPSATNVQLNPNSTYPKYSYTITPNGASYLNGYTITSIGITSRETRTVHAVINLQYYWAGIGVKQFANIKSNPTFGVIPTGSDYVFNIRTDSTGNNQVELFPNVTIPGDIIVGPGGNTDDVIDTKKSTIIQGDCYSSPDNIDFTIKPAPSGLVNSPLPNADANNVIHIPTGMYAFPAINLKQSDKLQIEGNVIFSTPSVTVGQGNALIVKSGGSLEAYIANSFVANQGSIITNENLDATKLKIFGLENCITIDIKNSGDFYGAIYAPNAVLTIYNSGAAYGGFVGKDLYTKDSAVFYFDARLLQGADDPAFFSLDRWWEEAN
jgi:hypothetical protein